MEPTPFYHRSFYPPQCLFSLFFLCKLDGPPQRRWQVPPSLVLFHFSARVRSRISSSNSEVTEGCDRQPGMIPSSHGLDLTAADKCAAIADIYLITDQSHHWTRDRDINEPYLEPGPCRTAVHLTIPVTDVGAAMDLFGDLTPRRAKQRPDSLGPPRAETVDGAGGLAVRRAGRCERRSTRSAAEPSWHGPTTATGPRWGPPWRRGGPGEPRPDPAHNGTALDTAYTCEHTCGHHRSPLASPQNGLVADRSDPQAVARTPSQLTTLLTTHIPLQGVLRDTVSRPASTKQHIGRGATGRM